jgi:hypothetical protein
MLGILMRAGFLPLAALPTLAAFSWSVRGAEQECPRGAENNAIGTHQAQHSGAHTGQSDDPQIAPRAYD